MSDDDREKMGEALEGMSVAPGGQASTDGPRDPRQDAGQDRSIEKRLRKNPGSLEAQLDSGLDETMDASDPVSVIQPGKSSDPAPSSGYDADAEKKRQNGH